MQLARSLPVKDHVADAIRAAEAQIAFPPEDVSADEPEGDYADDDASDGDSEDVPEEEEDLDRGPRMSRKII